ncbi:retropepsin-like aspartic protease family protein [Teredinibacter turnerae]|uniref:retropepsin-like aspartic protease family protein n=1 Tax=Teredinibacter turnerae TaxID=2426 RepID=UPI0030CC3A4B
MSVLKQVLLIGAAFSAGWVVRDQFTGRDGLSTGKTPSSQTQIVLEKDKYVPVFVDSSAPATGAPTESEPDNSLTVPAGDSALQQLSARNNDAATFETLLNNQQYQQAVNFYTARESALSESELQSWRAMVYQHLELKLSNAELRAFSELAETWLNYRYNDIKVILLQAQYNWAKGYINEALHSFIQADSYATSRIERSQVREQLYKFVVRYDAQLASAEDWFGLASFYEQLTLLGVASSGDKYRYAELLLMQGDDKTAFRYLEEISSDPSWRRKAQELRELWADEGEYQASSSPGFASSVPLRPVGDHYLVELRLNNGEPVRLMLDTGASITMLNTRAFGQQISATGWQDMGWRYFNTANGVAQGRLMQVASAQFGEFQLNDMQVSVQEVNLGGQIDGLLGMNVLSRFHFQIDQDNHQLLLTPRS